MRSPDEAAERKISSCFVVSSDELSHFTLLYISSQRLPADLRRNDDPEAVSVPTEGLLSETAGKTVLSNWGQGEVKLQGHRAQTLPDDAEGGGEEEAQGADSLGDRAGEHAAETGAGGAPRMPEKVPGVAGASAHTSTSLRNRQPAPRSAVQPEQK